MKKKCEICGINLNHAKTYIPYNTMLKYYMFGTDTNQFLCKKCAEKVVNTDNKCKGGHWILEFKEVEEAIKIKVQKYRSSGKGVNEDFDMRRITINCNSHDAVKILRLIKFPKIEISYE